MRKIVLLAAIISTFLLALTVFSYNSSSLINPKKHIKRLLFTEKFNRPNGLIATGSGLKDPLGKLKVTSEKLYAKNKHGYTDSQVFRVVTQQNNFSDVILSADLLKKSLANDPWEGLQLFFRYKDQYNLYVAGIRNDNNIHLKKKVGGNYYQLAIAPLNSTRLNHWYRMKIAMRKQHIQVFVDGIKYIDVYDSSFSKGRVGIRTDDIKAYFDNLKVTTF